MDDIERLLNTGAFPEEAAAAKKPGGKRAGHPRYTQRVNEAPEDFAGRILRQRMALGLTQSALAKRIGITRPAIRKYEAGKCVPTLLNAYDLACALGVSLEYLITGSDKRSNK